MGIEKKYLNGEKYEVKYYEATLSFSYNRTGSRRESKFLKLLEKNNIENINCKILNDLKMNGYQLSHKGCQHMAIDVVNKHKNEFQQGDFLVFQDNSNKFFIFKKRNKGKSFEFIKGTTAKNIICALRESN